MRVTSVECVCASLKGILRVFYCFFSNKPIVFICKFIRLASTVDGIEDEATDRFASKTHTKCVTFHSVTLRFLNVVDRIRGTSFCSFSEKMNQILLLAICSKFNFQFRMHFVPTPCAIRSMSFAALIQSQVHISQFSEMQIDGFRASSSDKSFDIYVQRNIVPSTSLDRSKCN